MQANINGMRVQLVLDWLTRPLILSLARFRHRRSGGDYTVLTGARVSASTRPLQEGDTVVVYIDHLGRGHARLHEEFHDGQRFELIDDES